MDNKPITSPVKAIRAFCLDCAGGSASFVKDCSAPHCALYPFRFGKNPFLPKRELTDEQRAELRDRIEKMRDSQKGAEAT